MLNCCRYELDTYVFNATMVYLCCGYRWCTCAVAIDGVLVLWLSMVYLCCGYRWCTCAVAIDLFCPYQICFDLLCLYWNNFSFFAKLWIRYKSDIQVIGQPLNFCFASDMLFFYILIGLVNGSLQCIESSIKVAESSGQIWLHVKVFLTVDTDHARYWRLLKQRTTDYTGTITFSTKPKLAILLWGLFTGYPLFESARTSNA